MQPGNSLNRCLGMVLLGSFGKIDKQFSWPSESGPWLASSGSLGFRERSAGGVWALMVALG